MDSAHIPTFQSGSIPAQKCKNNFGDNNGRREGGEGGEVSFSDGGFGGKYRPFSCRDEDGDGSYAGRGLGELPNFEIKYFQ